jgi:copper(I)-binding protein
MFMRTLLAAATVAALTATAALAHDGKAHDAMIGDLTVSNAWTRATAPSAKNGGAFMTIANKGGTPDRLVAASTPASAVTELHTHRMEDGVMKMRPVEGGIDVPAGGAAELKPGGLHVMFLGLKAPLAEGSTVPVTLTFEHAGTVTVDVTVMKAGASAPMGGHMGGHGEKPMDGHGKMMDGDKPMMPKH